MLWLLKNEIRSLPTLFVFQHDAWNQILFSVGPNCAKNITSSSGLKNKPEIVVSLEQKMLLMMYVYHSLLAILIFHLTNFISFINFIFQPPLPQKKREKVAKSQWNKNHKEKWLGKTKIIWGWKKEVWTRYKASFIKCWNKIQVSSALLVIIQKQSVICHISNKVCTFYSREISVYLWMMMILNNSGNLTFWVVQKILLECTWTDPFFCYVWWRHVSTFTLNNFDTIFLWGIQIFTFFLLYWGLNLLKNEFITKLSL